jgi:hypothetical protein
VATLGLVGLNIPQLPVQHQAEGLRQLFSGRSADMISVLAGPSAPDSHDFVLALAAALARESRRVWLVETTAGKISEKLGCRPLLPWRASQPLRQQVIRAGAYGLIHAPGSVAGNAEVAAAAAESQGCDYLLIDGGRFSLREAPLDPAAEQTLIVLLGVEDAEAGYALVKGLKAERSLARVLLMGEAADSVAQTVSRYMEAGSGSRQTADGMCQIGNTRPETSSNTLTIAPNLTWVVSRITQKDQPKVAHGGSGKGAEEVYER